MLDICPSLRQADSAYMSLPAADETLLMAVSRLTLHDDQHSPSVDVLQLANEHDLTAVPTVRQATSTRGPRPAWEMREEASEQSLSTQPLSAARTTAAWYRT